MFATLTLTKLAEAPKQFCYMEAAAYLRRAAAKIVQAVLVIRSTDRELAVDVLFPVNNPDTFRTALSAHLPPA